MTLKIQTPTTLNEKWLKTEVTTHIKDLIRDFFENTDHQIYLSKIRRK